MEFVDVVRRRRMIRNFDDRPLDAVAVDRVVAAGLRGPSAGYTQGVDLVVLEGPAQTGRYWNAALPPAARGAFPWPGLLVAPLLILVVSSEAAYRRRYAEPDKGEGAFDVPWWHVDAAFAALLLQLAAVDAGLGALFFAVHRPAAVSETFAIPGTYRPVGTVAVGHPAPDRPSSSVVARPRRTAADMVHRGGW